MTATASAPTLELHARVLDHLDACLALAREPEVLELRDDRVSNWNVGEQLEHLVLVDRGILDALEKTDPPAAPDGAGPTVLGRVLLALGYIPRGRGKAPKFVMPREVDPAALEARLEGVRERFEALGESLHQLDDGTVRARHHAFGHLDGVRWLRFVDIHHHHHWKIIRDIRKRTSGR